MSMKKICATAAALTLAAGAMAAGSADAHGRYYRHHHDHDRNGRTAAIVGGAVLGLAAASALSRSTYDYRRGDYYGTPSRRYYGGYGHPNRSVSGKRKSEAYSE